MATVCPLTGCNIIRRADGGVRSHYIGEHSCCFGKNQALHSWPPVHGICKQSRAGFDIRVSRGPQAVMQGIVRDKKLQVAIVDAEITLHSLRKRNNERVEGKDLFQAKPSALYVKEYADMFRAFTAQGRSPNEACAMIYASLINAAKYIIIPFVLAFPFKGRAVHHAVLLVVDVERKVLFVCDSAQVTESQVRSLQLQHKVNDLLQVLGRPPLELTVEIPTRLGVNRAGDCLLYSLATGVRLLEEWSCGDIPTEEALSGSLTRIWELMANSRHTLLEYGLMFSEDDFALVEIAKKARLQAEKAKKKLF
jgi:hypothetical protein